MATPKLSIPTLIEGQANSEATVNTALLTLDAVAAGRVEDKDLTAPPASPAEGATYIVGASPTGGWAGQAAKVAIYINSGWTFKSPVGGMTIFVHDEKELQCYSSQESAWFPVQDRHSTTEHWTGKYGEAGSKIYAKCFEGLACPNSTTQNHPHGITNIDKGKHIRILASANDGTDVIDVSLAKTTGPTYFWFEIDATNIKIISNSNVSSFNADIRLEYCRT